MSLLISLLPAGLFILLVFWAVRALYRYVFRNQILNRLERRAKDTDELAIADAIRAKDYVAFEHLIKTLDVNYSHVVSWGDDVLGLLDTDVMIQRYERENPNDARAFLMSGTYLIYKAWQARGSGYASTVSEESFRQFHQYLGEASVALDKSLALDKQVMPAYQGLLTVYKGLGHDNAAEDTLQAARAIDPAHLGVHLTRLDHLNAKWGGSDDRMFGFARSMAASDETGVLGGLIAAAHHDYWFSLERDHAKKYFNRSDVRKELVQAAKPLLKFRFPPVAETDRQRLMALNYLAFTLSLANRNRLARKAFKRIGSGFTKAPWNSLNYEQPARAYLKFKRWAGA